MIEYDILFSNIEFPVAKLAKVGGVVYLPIFSNTSIMKKLLPVCILALSICIGCNKAPAELIDATVSFSYQLPQSGSMTKTTADDVYNAFYDAHIKTKELLPTTYGLTIKSESDKTVAQIYGKWGEKHLIHLPKGSYKIVGHSTESSTKYYSRAALAFNETVEINENTNNINLTAIYDCFLLMFDKANKSEFSYSYDSSAHSMPEIDNLYYMFLSSTSNYRLRWENEKTLSDSSLNLEEFAFNKGYFYYFNDVNESFDIPKMQNGSI